ncbi:MAG: hypothetical protein WBA24_22420 [Geitlerinemataceae cyanobacterium]
MTNSSKSFSGFKSSRKEKFSGSGKKDLYKQVKKSGCFNDREYLELNPDVAAAVERKETTAIEHFVKHGAKENRQFSRLFDRDFYFKQYSDVRELVARGETTATLHFFQFGIQENRQPNALFNPVVYLNLNLDIKAAVENNEFTAIGHFFQFGAFEGRSFTSFISPILNRTAFQADYKQDIGSFFNVQSSAEIDDSQTIESIAADKALFVDIKYIRIQYAQQLEAFYGFSVAELSDEQVKTYAFGEGANTGIRLSAFNIEAYQVQFAAQLTTFYQVQSVTQLKQQQVVDFMVNEGIEQGIDLTAYVDIAYYRKTYTAALSYRFGETFSDREIIDFVFGDAAPFIDEQYYKTLYGNVLTADGILVANLDSTQLKTYVFSEAWDANKKLSAFNIEGYRIQYAAQLSLFYYGSTTPPSSNPTDNGQSGNSQTSGNNNSGGNSLNTGNSQQSGSGNSGIGNPGSGKNGNLDNLPLSELSDKEIVEFMFGEGLKIGINPIEFVEISEVRQLFSVELTRHYKVTSVTEISDNLVLDYLFGSVSEKIDYSYYRHVYAAQLTSAFNISVEQITDEQILDYVYQVGLAAGFKLSAIDFDTYIQQYQAQIATFFQVSIDEVSELEIDKIREFIFGAGVEQGLSFEGLVDVIYIRSTYAAAIASYYNISTEVVASLNNTQVFQWFSAEFEKIDLEYVHYEVSQLTLEQRNSLFTSLGISVDTSANLTAEQLVQIAYSSEFKAILEVEETKVTAIDIEAYRKKYAEEIFECVYGKSQKPGDSGKSSMGGDSGKSGMGSDSGKSQTDSGMGSDSGKSQTDSGMGSDSGKSQTDSGKSGMGSDNPDNSTDDTGSDADVDISKLSDKDILQFLFSKGWKKDIDVLEFVNVEYLRLTYEAELVAHYQVNTITELSNELVVDFVFGGLSQEIDYEYYRRTYQTQLTTAFGISIEQITETQILDHAYQVGLESDFQFSAIDIDGYVEQYRDEIAQAFKIDLEAVASLSATEIREFALETGLELGLELTGLVDINYYRQYFSDELLANYRSENVYNVDNEQTIDYLLNGGLVQGVNVSKAVDLEWYRQTYASDLAANQQTIDINSNGQLENAELFDYITGEGLAKGQNTSQLIDLEAYRNASSASAQAMLQYYQATDITQISYQQTLEYMFSVGLEAGYNPSGTIDLDALRTDATISQSIVSYYSVQSIEQVTYTQTFSYAFGAGYNTVGATIV